MPLFEELKRRNVIRVAVAYAIVAWLVAQIADLVLDNIAAPEWVMQVLFLLLAFGFVAAIIIAWAYELTPEGIKRESEVVRDDSITNVTAKKLDYITLVAVAALAGLIGWQQLGSESSTAPPLSQTNGFASTPLATTARLGAHSIAVLPFENRSSNEDDLFFTDGIHDDLLTQLAKIDDLKVISRTSVMTYRDTTKRIPQIAEELGVAKVLEGGVQRAGKRIRINAQLIDVATDEHLWAETFEEEMTIENLFDIQSQITRKIVSAVKGKMSPDDDAALTKAPTTSIPAFEAYLRAKQVLNATGYNAEKFQAAQPLVERALALDANFALAHLMLAELHSYAYWMAYDASPARKSAARASIDRAAEILGPDGPEVLAAEGNFLYRFETDYKGAYEAQLRALELMPGDSHLAGAMGATERRLGLWDESLASMLLAHELEPTSADAANEAANTMLGLNRFKQLQTFMPLIRERFPNNSDLAAIEVLSLIFGYGDTEAARLLYDTIQPGSGENYATASTLLPLLERDYITAIEIWNLPEVRATTSGSGWIGWREVMQAVAYRKLGENAKADALLQQVIDYKLDDTMQPVTLAYDLSTRSYALVQLGKTDLAIATAERAMRLLSYENDKYVGLSPVAGMCYVLAQAGKRDQALALLPRVLDQPGGFTRWELYLSPLWDFMRDDERFNEMIRPNNLKITAAAKAEES